MQDKTRQTRQFDRPMSNAMAAPSREDTTPQNLADAPGAQPRFQSWGSNSLVYVIAENNIRMVYPVSCTAVCCVTVITLFINKVGVVCPIFLRGGADPSTRSGCALVTPSARVPCNNASNIVKRKTWTQSEFCTWQNSVTEQELPKMYV